MFLWSSNESMYWKWYIENSNWSSYANFRSFCPIQTTRIRPIGRESYWVRLWGEVPFWYFIKRSESYLKMVTSFSTMVSPVPSSSEVHGVYKWRSLSDSFGFLGTTVSINFCHDTSVREVTKGTRVPVYLYTPTTVSVWTVGHCDVAWRL